MMSVRLTDTTCTLIRSTYIFTYKNLRILLHKLNMFLALLKRHTKRYHFHHQLQGQPFAIVLRISQNIHKI